MKRLTCTILMICLLSGCLVAQNPDRHWAVGLSGISPGLPVAVKCVWQSQGLGAQIEGNYYYALGMLRIDGRKIIVEKGRWGSYGFVGITANHFNDGITINNTLWADVGGAATVRFGKKQRFELGFEAGLLIPFWSNLGLDQYNNTGFMVANIFALWWI
ncbi:MAG: hypothetical protein GXY60_03115 [Spirochaetales bacterium]|nr:hypothetical protein [Spirochaetales bacterium]